MQQQEMIHPSTLGMISRTCLFSLIGIVSVFLLV